MVREDPGGVGCGLGPAFLVGEPGQRIGPCRLVAHPLHQPAGRVRVQHRFTRGHGAHRADQVGAADLLSTYPAAPAMIASNRASSLLNEVSIRQVAGLPFDA